MLTTGQSCIGVVDCGVSLPASSSSRVLERGSLEPGQLGARSEGGWGTLTSDVGGRVEGARSGEEARRCHTLRGSSDLRADRAGATSGRCVCREGVVCHSQGEWPSHRAMGSAGGVSDPLRRSHGIRLRCSDLCPPLHPIPEWHRSHERLRGHWNKYTP